MADSTNIINALTLRLADRVAGMQKLDGDTSTIMQIARMNEERKNRQAIQKAAREQHDIADAARVFAVVEKTNQMRAEGAGFDSPDATEVPEDYRDYSTNFIAGQEGKRRQTKEQETTTRTAEKQTMDEEADRLLGGKNPYTMSQEDIAAVPGAGLKKWIYQKQAEAGRFNATHGPETPFDGDPITMTQEQVMKLPSKQRTGVLKMREQDAIAKRFTENNNDRDRAFLQGVEEKAATLKLAQDRFKFAQTQSEKVQAERELDNARSAASSYLGTTTNPYFRSAYNMMDDDKKKVVDDALNTLKGAIEGAQKAPSEVETLLKKVEDKTATEAEKARFLELTK